jgi:2-polyprenyl-3-methyl-5-hydroxy-6-metoxy-1,4-benzoquinol methylase
LREVNVATDIWQQLESAESSTIDRIVERLEMRGRDDTFVALTDRYLDLVDIDLLGIVLELGCGTGVISRSIAARPGFAGSVVGSDYSTQLVEAAQRFAQAEGVGDLVRFDVEDAQATRQPSNTYDAVILHTVVSHLPDPASAVGEAVRVAKPGGVVVVFDGDYASLTIHTGHPDDDTVLQAIRNVSSANHHVMRAMPGIMKEHSLSITEIDASVLAAAGESPFFGSLATTYVPLAVASGELDQDLGHDWMDSFEASSAAGTAFASCNYLSYIAQPD